MNSVLTDTETIIEIICTRNYAQLNEIKKIFKQIYKKELEEMIKKKQKEI